MAPRGQIRRADFDLADATGDGILDAVVRAITWPKRQGQVARHCANSLQLFMPPMHEAWNAAPATHVPPFNNICETHLVHSAVGSPDPPHTRAALHAAAQGPSLPHAHAWK